MKEALNWVIWVEVTFGRKVYKAKKIGSNTANDAQ